MSACHPCLCIIAGCFIFSRGRDTQVLGPNKDSTIKFSRQHITQMSRALSLPYLHSALLKDLLEDLLKDKS